jgi:hypothetical protein
MIPFGRHDQRQVGIILSNKDNNIMATRKQKYFKKDLSHYVIISVKSPTGKIESWAKQLAADEMQTIMYSDKYKLVKEESVEFRGFLINPDLDDAGYPDPIDDWEEPEDEGDVDFNPNSSKLKAMLEGLKKPVSDTGNTLGQAADILGMIKARQENEIRPTVILNPRKYTDSKTLESALEGIRQKDAEAHILVGTTRADDFLATLKNQETIGLSSVPDPTKPLGLMLDQEALELIKQLRPKK